MLAGYVARARARHRAGRRRRRRHHRVAVSVRRRGDGAEPWWPALDAPDLIDPARHTVLAPCWPGNGSTWRGFDEGAAAAAVGARARRSDRRVARRHRLHDAGDVRRREPRRRSSVSRSRCAIPTRVAKLVTISAGLRPDGWGTATRHLQRELVRDGLRTGDVATGMVRARQLGMLTYRGRDELDTRFGVLAPGSRAAAGRRVSRSSRPAVRAALPGAHVPAAQRGDRSLRFAPTPRRARRARARDRRRPRRRRARRSAVPVRAAARAVSRAAGGRRERVAVEARLRVRPRRVPRRSGQARRAAARHRLSSPTRDPRAALRRRRREAAARDPDRHDRLRHRRRTACSSCSIASSGALAERYGVRFRVTQHRGARPREAARPARRGHPAHDARARSRRAIPTST